MDRVVSLSGELQEEDLLANDSSVVVVTAAGYIKRMPLEEFTAQNRYWVVCHVRNVRLSSAARWDVEVQCCWCS